MKIPLIVLLTFCSAIARAENFAWNAETNLKLFADPANWHTEGGTASQAPGASDNIVSPLQYGIVSIAGTQEVASLSVNLDKKWLLIGKGAWTIHGSFTKAGHELIVRDGNRADINFDVAIHGALTLESGILRFGQEAEFAELQGLRVQGPATVRDGELLIRSVDAVLAGGLTVELGVVAVYQGSGSGGITVRGITGGAEGVICASTSGTLQPEAVLTVDLPEGRAAFDGTLKDGAGGTLALVKTGSGVQVLTGDENIYSGGTRIEGGTLSVQNGAAGKGAVHVAGTGILAGSGPIDGAVELVEQGVLSPGAETNQPGVLLLRQGLVVKGGGASIRLDLGKGPDEADAIKGEGEFSPGGRLTLVVSGQSANRNWKLFDGFSVQAGQHFAAVELDGDAKGRLTRNGDLWTGTVSGLKWTFSETSGVLSVAR